MVARIDRDRRLEKGKLGGCCLADDGCALAPGEIDNRRIDARTVVRIGRRPVAGWLIEGVENVLDADGDAGEGAVGLDGGSLGNMGESLDVAVLAGDGIAAERRHQFRIGLARVARLDQSCKAHHVVFAHPGISSQADFG